MPTITTYDPASAAADALGGFLAQKRQNTLTEQAQAYQKQRDTVADTQANRAFNEQHQQNQAVNARDQARLELEAKQEASTELHQAREDALKEAQEKHAETQDNRAFALEVQKIDEQFRLGVAKVNELRDAAQIHAAATVASANIRASATVQAAGISAAGRRDAARISSEGADARQAARLKQAKAIFTQRDLTTRRGQNMTSTAREQSVNAANQRSVMNASLRMSLSKGAPKAPTPQEDPKFAEAMQRFSSDTPEQRAALIANPNVPAKTKAYFQALSAFMGAEPSDVTVPYYFDEAQDEE